MASDRVRISSPTADWERGTELDLQEGPELLTNGGATFVVYSTRESWLKDYRLGTLRFRGGDPLQPASWEKSAGPVFTGNTTTYGVGHASFTQSPDGSEWWIAYHSKIDATPASTNDSTTAGPEFCAATVPVSTKIPVPMIAPMPSSVRLNGPSARRRLCSLAASA